MSTEHVIITVDLLLGTCKYWTIASYSTLLKGCVHAKLQALLLYIARGLLFREHTSDFPSLSLRSWICFWCILCCFACSDFTVVSVVLSSSRLVPSSEAYYTRERYSTDDSYLFLCKCTPI